MSKPAGPSARANSKRFGIRFEGNFAHRRRDDRTAAVIFDELGHFRRAPAFQRQHAEPGQPGFGSIIHAGLVTEMPDAGEHHGHAELVCGVDHILIVYGTARLDYRRRARLARFLDAVGKRKKCVGGNHAARE